MMFQRPWWIRWLGWGCARVLPRRMITPAVRKFFGWIPADMRFVRRYHYTQVDL